MPADRSRSDSLGRDPAIPSWTTTLAILLVLAMIATLAAAAFQYPLDPDTGWYMAAARRLLAGERLYTDIIEVNPPLVLYLMTPPALLADHLRIADDTALGISLIFLITLSLGLTAHLLMVGRNRLPGIAWLLLVAAGALLVVPAVDFGQREHLMIVLVLPFVLVKWRRACALEVSAWMAWVCGVAAGLGFALKPFFLLVWIAVEVLSAVQVRQPGRVFRLRPETSAVAILLMLYAGSSLVFHPEYFTLMRDISGLYRAYAADGSALSVGAFYAVPVCMATAALFLVRTNLQQRRLACGFLVMAAAGLLMAVVQGKGWRYHFLPGIVATVLALGVLAEASVRTVMSAATGTGRARAVGAMMAVSIGAYLLAGRVTDAFAFQDQQRRAWASRVATLAPFEPESILVLGEFVADAFPTANYLGTRSVSPFPSLWWIRAAHQMEMSGERGEVVRVEGAAERGLYDRLIQSFLSRPPDLVLVDTAAHAWAGGAPFPYIEYLSQDSAFAAVWAGYARVGTLERFVVMSSARERGLRMGGTLDPTPPRPVEARRPDSTGQRGARRPTR